MDAAEVSTMPWTKSMRALTWVIIIKLGREGFHDALDLLGLAGQPEGRKELAERVVEPQTVETEG